MDTPQLKASWKRVASVFTWQVEERFHVILTRVGTGVCNARKKGLLSENDRNLRIQFARKMKHVVAQNRHFWTHEIGFYLDAVSFVRKYNPQSAANINRSRVWRQKSEGLNLTTNGSKDLASGRRSHLLAAVTYKKGVILAVPYENMNGTFFAQFIRTHFNTAFGHAGPKQNGQSLFSRIMTL